MSGDRPRILIAEPLGFSPAVVAQLSEKAEVDLRDIGPGDIPEVLDSYDVFWFRLAHRLDSALVARAKRCRVVATPVTGIDHIDVEACQRRSIKVVSLKGEVEFLKEVRATAELTIGLMMAVMRRIVPAAGAVQRGEWKRDAFRGSELFGKTVGLIGLGRLGALVSGYLTAFGAHVVGFDVKRVSLPGVETCSSLAQLLSVSDVVSVHVDLNPSSQGLVGAQAFAQMRRGAWFINTSRGGVVDEASLLSALESGHLAGAALDVLSGEPAIDLNHPVVKWATTHPNLLVVPHIGGNTKESFQKTEAFIAQRVLEALAP